MRYFQHVLNPGRIESVRHPIDLEVYAADPIWEEVTLTPTDADVARERIDSDVIERVDEVVRVSLLEVIPKFPGSVDAVAQYVVGALAALRLLTPAGAAWHTDPPPGWSTFGAHAFMDEAPALEFWGEEYGGDGLPIWERPVPARDADVAERIAQAWDEGYQAHEDEYWCGDGKNPYRATPPVAATPVGLCEHAESEGICTRSVGHEGAHVLAANTQTAAEDRFLALAARFPIDPSLKGQIDAHEGDSLSLGHYFLGVRGVPDDDECTYRSDGTDWTYCGETEAAHYEPVPATEAVSGYTSHGHRITGVVQTGRPASVARCGGPGLCTVCSREAAATGEGDGRG